jgi:glycosyltransferase involved in cell wall biosynthesis
MKRNIGIYNLHMQAMGGGEKLTLVLAEHLSLHHNVSLFCAEPVDVSCLEQYFDVDLSRINVVTLKDAGRLSTLVARLRGNSAAAVSQQHYDQLRQLKLDLFINNSYGSGLICPAARGIFMCMFPHAGTSAGDVLGSYPTIVTISEYSAEWVQRRWRRSSEIVYPPCDDMGPPETKQKIILHVGRFIADSDQDERHHKGQGLLLTIFKQITDLQRAGWELHLTGSVGDDKLFADSLLQAANGLPVVFHFNSSREQLRSLYRKAAIYWHATGYGVDVNQYPGKQEHFGISTVEAMSAGAVPLVYASGGQKEIVTDGVDGSWWSGIDELVAKTRMLAKDQSLSCRLGQTAVHSSKRFNRQAFVTRMDQLIARDL